MVLGLAHAVVAQVVMIVGGRKNTGDDNYSGSTTSGVCRVIRHSPHCQDKKERGLYILEVICLHEDKSTYSFVRLAI